MAPKDSDGLLHREEWHWLSLQRSQIFMLKAAVIVGGGGFVYGYDIGVISGALSQVEDEFGLGSMGKGLVVACLPLGSVFGCTFGGPLCDYVGRWNTIIIQNIIYISGALIISGASSVELVYIGRFVVGVGTALSGIADVPYLTEISPPQYRGRLSSSYEFLAVVGILGSFVVNLLLRDLDEGWRVLFAVPAVFAFLQATLMTLLPESPKWLIQNGMEEKGRTALQAALDTEEEVELRFREIADSHNHSSDVTSDFKEAFRKVTYEYRIVFTCIILLMFFQQFTGGVVVRNYAPIIFKNAGFGEKASLTFTVVLGIVKVITVGWSIYNMDRLGRKYLLTLGIAVMTFGQLVLAVAFAVGYGRNIGVFVVGGSLILGGFSIGLGPVTWLLQSEMFPTIIRGRAMALSVVARNLFEFIVNFAFLPVVDTIHDAGTFFLFFCMCVLGMVFVRLVVVETKHREPEDILRDFQSTNKAIYCHCLSVDDDSENASAL